MRPRALLVALFCLAVCSCEKLDFSEKEQDTGMSAWQPAFVGTGEGTEHSPYTVTDILQGAVPAGTAPVWVIGYVVGATYRSLSAAEFSAGTAYSSKILLSSDSLCTDVEKCIPVELSGAKLQRLFSLPGWPEGFRQCLLVLGTPARYFSRNGLRNISEGHWLFGFNVSTIAPEPEEWESPAASSR